METVFMSEGGELACDKHAPYRGSDTWVYGRWSPLVGGERAELESMLDGQPLCECCRARKRRGLDA